MSNLEEYQYENFKYILTNEGKLDLETNPEFHLPKELFKYYAITEKNVNAILNSEFYSTHPKKFNDSLDCSELILNFENLTEQNYDLIFKSSVDESTYNKLDIKGQFQVDKNNDFQFLKEFTTFHFTRKIGIISFTTEPLNVLMWSHYTNEKGIAIGIETLDFLNSLEKLNSDLRNYVIRPVQYVEKVERIDVTSPKFQSPFLPYFYLTNIKRKYWDYECEWRMTVFKDDMDIPFDFLYPGTTKYEGKNNRLLKYERNVLKFLFLGKYYFNGNNCNNIKSDGSFNLINNEENENFVKLTNWIYENHNDKLFLSGERVSGNEIIRIVGKIELEKLDENRFKVIDLKEVYHN